MVCFIKSYASKIRCFRFSLQGSYMVFSFTNYIQIVQKSASRFKSGCCLFIIFHRFTCLKIFTPLGLGTAYLVYFSQFSWIHLESCITTSGFFSSMIFQALLDVCLLFRYQVLVVQISFLFCFGFRIVMLSSL